MYAIWEQIEYTVQFFANRGDSRTTIPQYIGYDNVYDDNQAYTTIKVKFDGKKSNLLTSLMYSVFPSKVSLYANNWS